MYKLHKCIPVTIKPWLSREKQSIINIPQISTSASKHAIFSIIYIKLYLTQYNKI